MENMKVALQKYDFSESELILAKNYASFIHQDACEFICYLGFDSESSLEALESIKEEGFSDKFCHLCQQAIDLGYNYICFYS